MFTTPQVNVFATDVDRSVRFYRGFGFIETFRTPMSGPPAHVELVLDGLKLGIGSAEAARDVHGLEVSPGARAMAVCLWTDDVGASYDSLTEAGAPSLTPPHEVAGADLRIARVADPDGNIVELVQHLHHR